MKSFSPNYTYFIDSNDEISLKLTEDLNEFNPTLLNIGDLKKPSRPIEVMSVVFDLEGFTSFTKQVDPQLTIPSYISEFFEWLFQEIKNKSLDEEGDDLLYSELPFFSKFMGDGALFLWKIDMDKIAEISKDVQTDKFIKSFNLFICNIIACMHNICESFEGFYKLSKKKYVNPPTKLRCGIARGNAFPIGDGFDFVGPCINISSRLQKFNGLSFAFSARGIDEEEFHHSFKDHIFKKKVNIRGIGDDELIFVLKDEFDALPDDLKSRFKNV